MHPDPSGTPETFRTDFRALSCRVSQAQEPRYESAQATEMTSGIPQIPPPVYKFGRFPSESLSPESLASELLVRRASEGRALPTCRMQSEEPTFGITSLFLN